MYKLTATYTTTKSYKRYTKVITVMVFELFCGTTSQLNIPSMKFLTFLNVLPNFFAFCLTSHSPLTLKIFSHIVNILEKESFSFRRFFKYTQQKKTS